ncbi:hypothetical protein D9M72_503850 [compost metagenome]
MVPRLAPSVAKTKMIAGIVISTTGNCMIPSSRTISARRPAPGMPMNTKPSPTSSIWMNAMPTTPWATARMVAVHSWAICGPRSSPEIREAIFTALR